MTDILVRLEDGRGVITLSEPFFENDDQAAPIDLTIYGSLAKLGGSKATRRNEE